MVSKVSYISSVVLLATASLAGFFFLKMRSAKNNLIKKFILSRESYKEITSEIRKAYSTRYYQERTNSRNERRKLQARSAEYESCVLNFQKVTQKLLEEAQKHVISHYNLELLVFQESVNYYDSESELRECGEKMVLPIPQPIEVRLSKEETKNILEFYSVRMKEFENGCLDLEEYLALNGQIEDEIFRTFGIEIEELNSAFEIYKNDLEEIVEPLKNQTSYILASTDEGFEL